MPPTTFSSGRGGDQWITQDINAASNQARVTTTSGHHSSILTPLDLLGLCYSPSRPPLPPSTTGSPVCFVAKLNMWPNDNTDTLSLCVNKQRRLVKTEGSLINAPCLWSAIWDTSWCFPPLIPGHSFPLLPSLLSSSYQPNMSPCPQSQQVGPPQDGFHPPEPSGC